MINLNTWGAAGSKATVRKTDLEEWTEAVKVAVKSPSAALLAVTTAFQAYEANKTQTNLTNLASMLEVWRTTGNLIERANLATAADNVRSFITRAEKANQVITAKASNVGQSRLYTLVPAPWPATWTWCVALTTNIWPALKPADIAKINEAFDRSKKAAELARDAMVQIAKNSALPTVPNAEQASYVEWFGAYNQTRARKVHANFADIVDAFDKSVILYDIRNSDFGSTCYAACFRARVTRSKHRIGGKASTEKGALVTNQVKMLLGRAFFTRSVPIIKDIPGMSASVAYSSTTDATVGTMIHEMAHGTFKAVDAPSLLPDDSWELPPNTTVGDDYGATPVNSKQCSTPEMDRRLAIKDPSIAICNADSYGQFARACLERAGA